MIIYKTPEQIDGIRTSCKLLANVMEEVKAAVKPGVTIKQVNAVAETMIADHKGIPAFKGYRPVPGIIPFPSALCASVNDEVVHGIGTREYILQEGDIIGLDLGINLNGFYSDMAVTLPVGQITDELKQLLSVTKASLENGIKQMMPGNVIGDISHAIEQTITPHKYGIVKEFVGHGVGLQVHEDPTIPNYVSKFMKSQLEIELKPGMVLAVEPMVTTGKADVGILEDGWTVVTEDASHSAHFEHTIAILEDSYEVLTKLD